MTDVPDLAQRVDAALGRLGATQSVAELHGSLVGLLCAQGSVARDAWLASVAGAKPLADDDRDSLAQLLDEVVRQLNDPVLEFEPLLPDEDQPLLDRVDALGEWCQGFLIGLSEGGIKDTERLPADAAEVVRDMVNISRAGGYEFTDSEEDEQAYAELTEYVRAGVLLVNEELHPTKAAPRGDATLH